MAEVDNEWEYEYDENETEDFYIPVDLSNVPSAQVPFNVERRPGHPTLLKSRLRALNAVRGQLPEVASDVSAPQEGTQETANMGEVQITGLHTSNPLMMYNGQLLSCQWTSTIGTDMFFTKPHADDSNSLEPLRSLPSVDLLSLGTAKLVARVARLRPRDELFEEEEQRQVPSDQNASNTPSSAVVPNTQPAPTNSPNFLARLNEAKARRGEASRLVVTHTSDGSRLVSKPIDLPARDNHSNPTGDVTMGGT
ncbi:hypothetical protein HBH56_004050 [Parastagonospora nodorum]|uniref:Transcription factor TFIIIC triple barrel domain-containing protein n=2 Tax=Phaeosphaeria nodorum (strain SN15 / ATCC MYA-4574 / FGSC 10173) TaxID=321614 RepID=A0A7U2HSJ9_PHANO|nr:hypothetical protein SNOG_09718 [Parastagonospora nodorum SN15]KAH3920405.1 hypothetical protein HBH56_004050 [Parastagonospora nodorum]EAT82983.1 hypothetical protein SNOG_09718 [Parastagonospora nodorum SN15]KAH3938073.1 hypothetical protein HBH54_004040 [Parastagonospora nodorum]KAH3946488.1 hypothetical protein HBH53_127940 [Parastagonospora nodorum]KAH3974935.1 hypothetical protein HBH51_086800 [Parastagonospora nodorum]